MSLRLAALDAKLQDACERLNLLTLWHNRTHADLQTLAARVEEVLLAVRGALK